MISIIVTFLVFGQIPFVDHFDRTEIPLTEILNPRIPLNFIPFVDSIIQFVDEDSIYSYIFRLQDFQIGYSYSDSVVAVSQWLYMNFSLLGMIQFILILSLTLTIHPPFKEM